MAALTTAPASLHEDLDRLWDVLTKAKRYGSIEIQLRGQEPPKWTLKTVTEGKPWREGE